MMARRQVRLAALAALQQAAATLNPAPSVTSPADWTTDWTDLPAWRMRVGKDVKASGAKSVPTFTTTVTLEIEARVSETTAEAAQDAIEAMGDTIENGLFTYQPFYSILEQVGHVTNDVAISAEGKTHLAGIRMLIDCELFETFEIDPDALPALEGVDIHADLQNVVDKTGMYADPPFPSAVVPPPRTVGPDGRDEGALQINLPTS